MDSSTVIERAFGEPAPNQTGTDGERDSAERTGLPESWLRRHGWSLLWFLPVIAFAVVVHAFVLGVRGTATTPSLLTGGLSAVGFALISATLLWVLARRLRFTRPIAAAALLLFLFSPLALVAHTVPSVQNAVVPWMLAGTVILLRRRSSTRLRMTVGALLGLVLVLSLTVPFDPAPGGEGVALPLGLPLGVSGWWSLDPALLIVGGASTLVGLAIGRVRVFAAVSLALLLLAVWPEADVSTSLWVPLAALWVPLAALLIGAMLQVAVSSAFDTDFTKLWVEVVSGVSLVAVVGVFIFAAPVLAASYRLLAPGGGDGAGSLAQQAGGSAGGSPAGANQPGVTGVASLPAADPAAQPSAEPDSGVAGTDGGASSAQAGEAGAPGASVASGTEVGDAAAPGAASTAAPAPAEPLTTPTGGAIDPVVAAQASAAAQAAARASAGRDLSVNPRLTLTPDASTELTDGRVDVRAILALGQLLAQTDVRVDDFPELVDEASEPRRQILITGIGGDAALSNDAVERAAMDYFSALADPLGGASVVSTAAGVLVIFPYGEPVELLPGAVG